MRIRLRKNQRLWNLTPLREDLRQNLLLKRPDDRSNLTRIHHIPVKLPGSIQNILLALLPASLPRQTIPPLNHPVKNNRTVPRHISLDNEDIPSHIHIIENRLFVRILAHQIPVKKPERPVIGRCRQPDNKRIEVIQNLLPDIINRPVTLIDHDQIKKLDRILRTVTDLHRAFQRRNFIQRNKLRPLIERLTAKNRIHPLNRRDTHMGILRNLGCCQPAHIIQLGKQTRIIIRAVFAKLLLSLFSEIFRIDQKQNPFCLRKPQKTIDGRDRRKCFSRSGRHLNKSTRAVFGKRLLQIQDCPCLALTKTCGIKRRKIPHSISERLFPVLNESKQRLRTMKRKDLAGPRIHIHMIRESDENARCLVGKTPVVF